MRTPACVLVGAVLCVAVTAQAGESAPSGQAEVHQAPAEGGKHLPWFGATLDVGVPEGVSLSAVMRPWYFLRLSAGAAYNGLSPGIRGGVTLIPLRFPISPTLSVEGGHFFPGDANAVLEQIAGPGAASPLLSSVSYDFATAHVGLEVGSPSRFVFFLRGGVSYVQFSVPEVEAALQQQAGDSVSVQPPNVRFTLPSLKLGFVLYLG